MFKKILSSLTLIILSLTALFLAGVAFIYVQSFWDGSVNTETLESQASLGDAEAQYQLALRYKNGTGIPKNLPKAIELFTKAAEQSHAKALHSLGYMYIKGIGVTKNANTARTFFEKSAALNFDVAMYNLGLMYQDGIGTQQDYQKAFSLYEHAEKLGNPEAKAALGHMYHNGFGREKDLIKAFSYYMRAAKQGSASAEYALGGYYEYGKGNIGKDLTKAREWYEKSAAQNFPDALYRLGELYFYGKGVNEDYLKSGEYFARAASLGIQDAQDFLEGAKKSCVKNQENKLYNGRVLKVVNYDLPRCFLAAHTDDPASMHATGLAYYAGVMNLKKDYKEAQSWFLPCAERGYHSCQMHLAILYDKGGYGVRQDRIEAYAWFSVALKSKNLDEEQKTVSSGMRRIIFNEFDEEEKIQAERKAKDYERDFYRE